MERTLISRICWEANGNEPETTQKSDLGKDWIHGHKEKKVSIQPEYHLIITEGTDMEPQYFNAIKDIINQKFRDRICLEVEGMGDNTLNLLEKAKQQIIQMSRNNAFQNIKFCVEEKGYPQIMNVSVYRTSKEIGNGSLVFHFRYEPDDYNAGYDIWK